MIKVQTICLRQVKRFVTKGLKMACTVKPILNGQSVMTQKIKGQYNDRTKEILLDFLQN